MEATTSAAIVALNKRFLLDYPHIAAQRIEAMPPDEAAEALRAHDANTLVPVMPRLSPEVAAQLLANFEQATVARLLTELSPGDAARILASLEESGRKNYLGWLEESAAREIRRALEYPADSAGHLMETRIAQFRGSATVGETLARLRKVRAKTTRSLFIVDEDNRLSGRASIQDIALAAPETRLDELARPVAAAVSALAPTEEVVEVLERSKLADLPVIDIDGRLLGIIYHATLLQVVQEDATADIQTMVGASKDERALSPTLFAVRKRLPWMQINLLTAFLAASVVGLFESTIAQFTALAVLLPVVAGQAGNAGAQALAVTMRGLALREIGLRHWFRVTRKEVQTGLINGLAIALTCGIGVFAWSGSLGLVVVIAMSMVLAMVAAGFAGALVPIMLTRLGQDPAQSSSIILTTVTDVAGFFSFLGIATLLAGML
ncbi:MAG TPA: magnesium transporter [Gammaproteobacteria bacterium]|nr:magnesium transporter [Gammaproteobacteria bacterium]